MQRSKQHAIMFLLGTLLTGGVTGFAVGRTVAPPAAKACEPVSFRQQVARALELDTVQVRQLDAILDQRNDHLREAVRPVQPQLDSIKGRAREQIRQMLRPEQRTLFETFLASQEREKGAQTSTHGAKQ